ncbi:hypothetical protein [Bacteroides sp.]|uniref:hypothetical protein n=1 Tax=Bacteroides sp. TaxID=29523 RepID=UPI00263354DB|nr:hypothetical protein [Bacteroides sp.]MDD3039702.1 hypothetical protein [Bacteroides sp.]
MIGQIKCLENVDKLIAKGFPRFVLITGCEKSGKKILSKEIAKRMGVPIIVCGIKVEEVREIISLAYKQGEPVIYLFPNIDDMSINAKNALLKVTEEPPRQAYFIITAKDRRNVLPTLLSRSYDLPMDLYSYKDLMEYIDEKGYTMTAEVKDYVRGLSVSPGDIDMLAEMDITAFKEFTELVLANIGVVNGANALKIGRRFAYKPEEKGWDIKLFMRAIMNLCLHNLEDFDIRYHKTIQLCGGVITKLSINGIDKKTLVDMWILDMRSVWMVEE